MKRTCNLFTGILLVFLSLANGQALNAQTMDYDLLWEEEPATIPAKDLLPKSRKAADLSYSVPSDCDSFGFDLTLNNAGGELKIQFELADEPKKKYFTMFPTGQSLSFTETNFSSNAEIEKPSEVFSNHAIAIRSKFFNFDYFVMPCFERYSSNYVYKNIAKWDEKIPNALNRKIRIDLRAIPEGIALYLDGVYAKHFPGGRQLKKIWITGGTGPSVEKAKAYRDTLSSKEWQLIDFSGVANPGVMKDASISLPTGQTVVEGVPMFVLSPEHSSDISLVKGVMPGFNLLLETDKYMSRTAWERHPVTQQSAVPNGYYDELCLLFALDPDPKKDRYLTFRMGRFSKNGGRSTGWAYTDLVLPKDDARIPSDIKKVGTVKLKDKEVPLYFVRLPIECGDLLPFITQDGNRSGYGMDYLDFEFLGRRRGAGAGGSNAHKPFDAFPSAFNLFGMTFRKAGVHLDMIQSEPGNIFFNDEVPETTAVVTGVRPGAYSMKWTITDTWDKVVLKEGTQTFRFTKPGESEKVRIDLAQPDIGHYNLKIDLYEGERLSYTHHAAFALLGKDTRLATPAESPFGAWWTPYHLGEENMERAMEIYHKAGIRRSTGLGILVTPDGKLNKKDILDKYKITLNQIPWNLGRPPDHETDPEGFDKYMRDAYDKYMTAFPDMKYVLVWHEGGRPVSTPELQTGKKVNPQGFETELAVLSEAILKWLRKNHPDRKILFGNAGSSLNYIAALLRNDISTDLIDFVGIETPGIGRLPESLNESTVQSSYLVKALGRVYGKELKVSGCYEFSARSNRLFPVIQEQAAFYMRDGLLGLCHGFETLGLSGLCDAGDAYPQTIWGGGGLCRKAPLLYPKPMISAYAAMTRALDRIKPNPVARDTGNLSLYVPEFERKDGKIAYAFWVPKGEVRFDFDFPEEIEAEYIEPFGKTSTIRGKKISMTATIYPQYLVVPCKADQVRHIATISPAPPESYKPEIVFDSMDKIIKLDGAAALPLRPGKFEVKAVEDEQMGKCLEIRLIKEGNIPEHISEYARIELKNPITLNGTPDELGYWVKGDGGWGRISFDIQDAKGKRFRNYAGWADFEGNTVFNFKGWYFMKSPLYGKGIRAHHTRSLTEPWVGEGAWGSIVFPVKVIAMHIILNRNVLSPTTMKPADAVIRLKEMGGIHNPQYQESPELQKGPLPE